MILIRDERGVMSSKNDLGYLLFWLVSHQLMDDSRLARVS